MATYKVLQDIEAEDKLVGPLTLRQFIYAGITAVCLYICFILVTKKLYFGLPIFLLPGMLTGFFAFPFGRDQPTEIWALAKIRFMLKPRRRIWNQSGVKELVTITAPKRVEVNYTNGLSQVEVKSRLQALADTIDTRGWAVKNVTQSLYAQPIPGIPGQEDDRLIAVDTMPQEVPMLDARNAADVMDDQTSPVAMNFDRMIEKSDETHRQNIIRSMSRADMPAAQAASPINPLLGTTDVVAPQLPAPQMPQPQSASMGVPGNGDWFMNQSPVTPGAQSQIVTPSGALPAQRSSAQVAEEEHELAEKLREQNNSQETSYAHLHTILPLSEQQALAQKAAKTAAAAKAQQAPVTHHPDPAIIALASNNDLNVATIARQAKRDNPESPDEVVISLH